MILVLLSLLASGCQIQARQTSHQAAALIRPVVLLISLSLSLSTEGFSLREAGSTLSQGRLYLNELWATVSKFSLTLVF